MRMFSVSEYSMSHGNKNSLCPTTVDSCTGTYHLLPCYGAAKQVLLLLTFSFFFHVYNKFIVNNTGQCYKVVTQGQRKRKKADTCVKKCNYP